MPLNPGQPDILTAPGGWLRLLAEVERVALEDWMDPNKNPVYGALSGFANEMIPGLSPISKLRPPGFTFTLGPRGQNEYATKQEVAKALSGHGHPAYDDALRKLSEGLARGTAQASARDGGSYRGMAEAEALMRSYTQGDDLSGFILGYSTGKQFNVGSHDIAIEGPKVRPSVRRGWEYSTDPTNFPTLIKAIEHYMLEKQTLSGRR